ncbi:hypothetical protein [Paraburkholderia phytofirmans]|uniref:Uncharacterized protein n=1 Tax=Paraburkholderia phytofirmans (strain DSM 17436 / LMG 22146 / PsJN) TaxID=398527 RepID=B2TH80_PARPJ|nr:hypothetical protein [Paraburkholderia phytofirmans]ACD21625.1 hypothetical protein Bphyt_7340 [Paraburkholderia phytofirmans PsJN]
MGTLNIRLTVEEEAEIRQRMALAGERQMGPHIKRVYFGNLKAHEGPIADLKRTGELSVYLLGELAKKAGVRARPDKHEDELDENDLHLRIMILLYLMVYESVDSTMRAWADRFLNKEALETFLKAGG